MIGYRYSYCQSRTAWWTAEVWDGHTGEVVASWTADGPEGLVSALRNARQRVKVLNEETRRTR